MHSDATSQREATVNRGQRNSSVSLMIKVLLIIKMIQQQTGDQMAHGRRGRVNVSIVNDCYYIFNNNYLCFAIGCGGYSSRGVRWHHR